MPNVVITMPAYRAAQTLEQTVRDIPSGVADELILVDDASPDDTVKIAKQLGITVIVHPENRGYGGNQKTCYSEALSRGADIIVLLHPDYQYDPKAVPLLIAPIVAGDADMTFGSRFGGLGDPRGGGMPMYRFVGNRVTTVLENMMLGSRFSEMHSGMRAYSRSGLQSLPFLGYSDDFWFDTQMLVDAVTFGKRVVEVPIQTRYTKESSSIAVGPSLRYITESLAYCARRSLERGRRGRRTAVMRGNRKPRRLPSIGRSRTSIPCVLCGAARYTLVAPATPGAAEPQVDFACAAAPLGSHDDIVQCITCGLVRAVPSLPAAQIQSLYSQAGDPSYLEHVDERRAVFDYILNLAAGYVVPGRRLFEAGAGVGLFVSMASARGWDAYGIEPSVWAAGVARERFGANVEVGSVETHQAGENSADVAVMLDVLEHLADPLAALRRIRQTMHPEGLLVVSTINVDGLHARMRGAKWPWFMRSHLFAFSPETLARMLAEAGFRIVGSYGLPRSFPLSYAASRAEGSYGALARAAKKASVVSDPVLPFGALGDGIVAIARPS